MFNPTTAQADLVAKLAALEPAILGIRADAEGLGLRAAYIAKAGQIFAAHIESMAADADASVPAGRVDEEDAGAISDVCSDLAGRIQAAAERELV